MDELKKKYLRPVESRKRETLMHEEESLHQLILIVMRSKNLSYDSARVKVQKVIEHRGGLKPSKLVLYQRDNMLDKYATTMNVRDFIQQAKEEDLIIAPTFTTYLPVWQRRAWIGAFVSGNMERRQKLRAQVYDYAAAGEVTLSRITNVRQVLTKLQNNILSGTSKSRGSIQFCPSIHTTLTSTTRLITSTCNANSERLLRGRYGFLKIDIALGYCASIISDLAEPGRLEEWTKVLKETGFVTPSKKDILNMITRSTDLYFSWNDRAAALVQPFIDGLTDLERSVIYYTGSLWNIKELNPDYVREFVSVAEIKVTDVDGSRYQEALDNINNLMPELVMLGHNRFYNEIKGMGTRYPNYPKEVLEGLYLTVLEYQKHFEKYSDFLMTVIMSHIQPPNVFGYKEVIRDSIVMSDTDSGAHIVDVWVEWYAGNIAITPRNMTVGNLMVEVASLTLQWLLRGIMVNMNVAKDEIERQRLNLKPEFFMVVFNLMSVSKHYAAGLLIENGNVFEHMEVELKGGTLKNSAIPDSVRKTNMAITEGIMTDIIQHGKVSIVKFTNLAARMEAEMLKSMYDGKAEYLRTHSIDKAESYKIKDPTKNASQHAVFWNDIFGKNLDHIAMPPYRAVKVPVKLGNKTEIEDWLQGLPPKYQTPARAWFKSHNKTVMKTFYVPQDYATSYGLPAEIQNAMEAKRLVLDICKMLYISLEPLAFYRKDKCTVLETLGYSLDQESVTAFLDETSLGGLDVGWTDDSTTGYHIPIPEEAPPF